jgi:hypothetical protein
MAFDPGEFVQAASKLAKAGAEADHRTAVGRAYYGVYGHVRERLASSRDTTAHRIFGTHGKHGQLAKVISRTKAFRSIGFAYRGLLAARATADYVYTSSMSKKQALDAAENARWALRALRDIDDQEYRDLPSP